MDANSRARVLMIAPGCDGADVGESWSCFQWVRGVSQFADVTLLTMQRSKQQHVGEGLENVEVISWPEAKLLQKFERFSSIVKPAYGRFYFQARKWIKRALKSGRSWDVVHQVGPIALRYPSPASGLGLKLVMGPLAGSLETPQSFKAECAQMPWYVKLRVLDKIRLRLDPSLRRTYRDAALILGVAPYVKSLLEHVDIQRFAVMSETGVNHVQPCTKLAARAANSETVRLLYVGRLVRTKGLRDAIRALGRLRTRGVPLPKLILDVAGTGEDELACRHEAEAIGIGSCVRFHGRLDREELAGLFDEADIFLFPSFREPSGNVVFEALQHGLPVITSDRGGPGYVVNEQCGIRVQVREPIQYAEGIANAIQKLAEDHLLRKQLSEGAIKRIREIGLWNHKIQQLLRQYQEIANLNKEAFEPRVCA